MEYQETRECKEHLDLLVRTDARDNVELPVKPVVSFPYPDLRLLQEHPEHPEIKGQRDNQVLTVNPSKVPQAHQEMQEDPDTKVVQGHVERQVLPARTERRAAVTIALNPEPRQVTSLRLGHTVVPDPHLTNNKRDCYRVSDL
jgi:hypothetical protein